MTRRLLIEDFVAERDFPYCAKGRVVRIKHIVGKIVGVYPAGTKFTLLDFAEKRRREFATSYVINASQSTHNLPISQKRDEPKID